MRGLLRRLRSAPRSVAELGVQSVSRSHLGAVRATNEDRVLDRGTAGLWAVADGMGGHSGGEMAAETVTSVLAALAPPIGDGEIAAALERANRRIHEASAGRSGTTVVLLHIAGGGATIRWAGDSRAYLIRDGALKLLTRDHSVVQGLVDAGLLDSAGAARHPQANVITRALGIRARPELDSTSLALEPGDRLLLCSDGLSRTLRDEDVRQGGPIAAQADRLLANALDRDGGDNISLVLVEVGERS